MKIAVAKGDGIGPEIMNAVLKIFNAAGVPLEYEMVDMGVNIYNQGHSTGMTPDAKKTIEALGILFKGPMETPKGKGVKSINVTARKVWNTYANKRMFKSLHGVETVFSRAGIPIDITIVRENIEDTYGGIEHLLTHDVALCRRFITREGSLQVHQYAFEMARKKRARKVTCGHKANIMKLTDGLFLETFYEMAKNYPEILANDIIVDDLAMKLVVKPNEFDVVVLPNLQGDIISDLCAGLVGGLGFAPSANIGDNISIFEAVHGTAPDIAGKNIANPTALLMSGIMLLRHIGLHATAFAIEDALHQTLEKGIHTGDFNQKAGHASTTNQFADAIIYNLPSAIKAAGNLKDNVTFNPPLSLNQHILKVNQPVAHQIVGLDLFVEWHQQPSELALTLQTKLPTHLQLKLISNRGTQVWPSGSHFTECVDQYRVRLLASEGYHLSQQQVFDTANTLSSYLTICSVEMLKNFDGRSGFSLAQGQ
jgi:isocitrate dehydrogenase